jgi:hypothetical protein
MPGLLAVVSTRIRQVIHEAQIGQYPFLQQDNEQGGKNQRCPRQPVGGCFRVYFYVRC